MNRFLGRLSLGSFLDFLSFSLLVLFLSFVLGSFHTLTANAQSAFDSPRIKEKLEISDPGFECGESDISTTWFTDSVQYMRDHSNEAYADIVEQSINPDQYYWMVFESKSENGSSHVLEYIAFRQSDTQNFYTFGLDQSPSPSPYQGQGVYIPFSFDNYDSMYSVISFTTQLDNNCDIVSEPGVSSSSVSGTTDNPNVFGYFFNNIFSNLYPDNKTTLVRSIFFINMPFVEPTDYQGPSIPDSYSPIEKEQIRPNFTWALNNKNVKSHDYNTNLPTFTPDEGYYFVGYEIEWTLYKCSSWEEVGGICHDTDLKNHKIQPQDSDYEFNVTDYGHYKLSAQYLVQQCYDYDGIPDQDATPDYCFYVDLETEMPEYAFTSTSVYLEINGQSKTGDTLNMHCDVSGYCYDDDTTCFIQPDFFSQLTCKFNKQMNTGLINPSINAFKGVLTAFIVPNNPQCHIPIQNVKIDSSHTFPLASYSVQACTTSAQFRNSFPIAMVLINFFLALTTLFLIVRIINKLTDHNDTDMIAGMK